MDWSDKSSTKCTASTSGKRKPAVRSCAVAKSAFQTLLDRAERLLGHKQDVAAKIGITPSRYSKLYRGDDYSLGVANCFRLASVLRIPTQEVLRAAGKFDIAVALDEMFPSAELNNRPITEDAAQLLDLYHSIEDPEWRELAVKAVGLMARNSQLAQSRRSSQPESQTPPETIRKARGIR